ncbi:hypothetical protein L3Q82_023611, partial [Scortum barcoo]
TACGSFISERPGRVICAYGGPRGPQLIIVFAQEGDDEEEAAGENRGWTADEATASVRAIDKLQRSRRWDKKKPASVTAHTTQDHDANLRRVLHALNEAGLKLNMQKCKFNQTSLRFLGHTISKDGLHPDQDRVSAVADAPAPHDTSSLRSFLGLASWYKFTAACDTCPELTQLRRQIQAGWPQCKKNVAPELTPYFNVQDELAVDNSLVMRGTDRVVVPTSLRSRVVDLAHEGHQGIYNDKSAKTAPAPFTPVKLPDGPWEKVAIDIMGPFENATWDCRYIIALTDYYSKWPEVAFASTVTTEVIIRFLTSVFSREGNPSYLVSDNGSICSFISE